MDDGNDPDRTAALRAVLAEGLLGYAAAATPTDVETVLGALERFYTAVPQGQHARVVMRLADASGLPAPLLALWLYHAITLLRTTEGAELLVYLALRAAAVHGISSELVEALTRSVKPTPPRGH
jgi:hypothetical protein